jgi:hypothetical protein
VTADPAPRTPRRRQARSFRTVALGGLALSAILVAVAAALYLRFIRYERIAARHVPSGSVLAIRLDVQQAILYDPVRRNLLPLLGGSRLAPPDGDARVAQLEALTGIRRGDLREIVVARGASRADWVIVLTGLFPRDVAAPLLGASLASNGESWTLTADARAVVSATGIAVGRTADGAVLVASSEAELRAARDDTRAARELGLEPTGPGGFALGRAGLTELARWPSVLAEGELPRDLQDLERLTGTVTLGDRVGLTVTAVDSGNGAALRAAQRSLEMLRAFGHGEPSPAAVVARGAADRASIIPIGSGSMGGDRAAALELAWEREEVDRAFGLLAETIRARSQ